MNKLEDKIIIFSDGASKGNPGPGAYGAVIIFPAGIVKGKKNQLVIELGGFEKTTTNNRMELAGVIKALEQISNISAEAEIFTDSRYLINGITRWVFGWQKNNWQTASRQVVLNMDLWQVLVELVQDKKIKWNYVSGHSGVAGNERCDEIASALASGEKVDLYNGSLSDYQVKVGNLTGHLKTKSRQSKKPTGPAYIYLSLVNGVLHKDKTWLECEKRVKGKRGAKYQKALSEIHEKEILTSWGQSE